MREFVFSILRGRKLLVPFTDVSLHRNLCTSSSFVLTNCNLYFHTEFAGENENIGLYTSVHKFVVACTRALASGNKTMLTVHKSTGKRNFLVTP